MTVGQADRHTQAVAVAEDTEVERLGDPGIADRLAASQQFHHLLG